MTIATQLIVKAFTDGHVEVGLPGDPVTALRLLELAAKAIADKIEQEKQAKKSVSEEVRA